VFTWLQRTGHVPDDDMLRTFNMGIGLIVVCAPEHETRVLGGLAAAGERAARRIGAVVAGEPSVSYR
jgi:phosphoribosylformylglycinamidine cyclo-ligase